MFKAYFDASGHPSEGEVVSVAGFVAEQDQWQRFERNWKDTLNDFGVKALHMREFSHSVGEFTEWRNDEPRRREFLKRLIGIIRLRVAHSFASSVWLPDYNKVNQRYELSERYRPYALAGCTCLGAAKIWAKLMGDDFKQIDIVFEDGDADKGNLIKNAEAAGISVSFSEKRGCHAFEAADLLAYEHLQVNRKVLASRGELLNRDVVRVPLVSLSDIPGGGDDDRDWTLFSEIDLIAVCEKKGIPQRRGA